MKTKKKRAILASIAIFAMVAMTAPATLAEDRGEMPAESDIFWTLFALMDHPTDYTNCEVAVTAYVNELGYDAERTQGELQGMLGFCTGVASMPSEMRTSMTAEGVETSLFNNTTDWHHVNDLYFQKSENGELMGKINFSETIDFMSYDFMSFMNNFGNMVQFNDGYISLNAAMVPTMIDYGTTFTMYGLDFSTQPDIYVSNGSTMRKAIEGTDLEEIDWDATEKTLSFTPKHFSSFKAVQQGSTVKKMKISSVTKKTIKYVAGKTFKLTVKGKNLYKKGSSVSCTLGFQQAQTVRSAKNGKKVTCAYGMDSFSDLGTFPLTITVAGNGEVTKTNAVRIK